MLNHSSNRRNLWKGGVWLRREHLWSSRTRDQMILSLSMSRAHATLWLRRFSFVPFHCSSHNMSPCAGLGDAGTAYKCKETIAGNVTQIGHEPWGHFSVTRRCRQSGSACGAPLLDLENNHGHNAAGFQLARLLQAEGSCAPGFIPPDRGIFPWHGRTARGCASAAAPRFLARVFRYCPRKPPPLTVLCLSLHRCQDVSAPPGRYLLPLQSFFPLGPDVNNNCGAKLSVLSRLLWGSYRRHLQFFRHFPSALDKVYLWHETRVGDCHS